MKQLYRTLSLIALPLLVAACNTDYNFDNISLEVTVGDTDGIAIPLGDTGEITLESLLEESGLETNSTGTYGYEMEDQMSYTLELESIEPITGLSPTIDPLVTSFIGDINAIIPTFNASKELSFPSGISGGMEIPDTFPLLGQDFHMHYDPHTFEGEFTVDVPEQIAGIKALVFGANGEGSTLELSFDLGGIADVSQKRLVEKLNIELPAGFTLAKVENDATSDYVTISTGEDSTTPNHYLLENYTMSGSELTVAICVKSVDLSDHNIDSEGKLTIEENVTYDLDFTGSFKAGTVEAISPKVEVVANLELYDITIVTNAITQPLEIKKSIEQIIELPAEIKEIHSIDVCDNTTSESAAINLSLAATNLPLDYIELQDVEIMLPAYLSIDTPEGWSATEGTYSTSSLKIGTNGWNQSFTVNGVGELNIANGEANLSSEVGVKANIAIPAGQEITLKLHPEDIVITPTIAVSDLRVKGVTGIIDPDFSEYIEPVEVELGDFTDSLEGLEMELNLASPVLDITIDNPIGVGIDASIIIDAYKGGVVCKSITSPTLKIAPAATTQLYIVGDLEASGGEGYYVVNGLTDIIATLPEKLVLTLDAETNKETAHTLELKDSYTFNVAYAVSVPFAFSSAADGHIKYTTTIDDVDLSSVKDIDAVVEKLTLNIASQSSLPIDLTMSVELLDGQSKPIECVTSSSEGVIKGTTGTELHASTCAISLNIDNPEGVSPFAEIGRTKKVRCTFEGTTLAGGELRPEQKIAANLSLMLDKGITIDLGSLSTKPETEE